MNDLLERLQLLLGGSRLARERLLFYQGLATMMKAGIHICRSLESLARQSSYPAFAEALRGCAAYVGRGNSLSQALSVYPQFFPPYGVRLVHVGETSGRLHAILEHLARHGEASLQAQGRLQAALLYPAVVLLLCLGFLVIVPATLLQGVLDFVASMDVPLPLSTRFMLLLARFSWWIPPLLLVGIALASVLLRGLNSERVRLGLEHALFHLPGVGRALRIAACSQFCRALSLAYGAGVVFLEAVRLAAQASPWRSFEVSMEEAGQRVMQGTPISGAFRDSGWFAPAMIHMIAAGEASGRLAEMLSQAAQVGEQQLDHAVEVALSAVQPSLLLLAGLVVGFVLSATLGPMLKVIESL
ncbi:MAG: type II secretion system F family protein [Armatimonadetes bacterium]|nr:type II secretion system F family protein [Armatimonadota bacterium]